MAAINFPDSPSNGDTHVVGGVTYTYDSTETKWKTTINSNAFLPLSGGTVSGTLTVNDDLVVDTDTLFVDASAGRVGIGTAAPAEELHINSDTPSIRLSDTAGSDLITRITNSQGDLYFDADFGGTTGDFVFRTNGERARIDSSGRLLVGTSSSSDATRLVVQANSASSSGTGSLYLLRGNTNPTSGQNLTEIQMGNGNANMGASIVAACDGNWTDGTDQPTRLVFSTTADGAASPTERLRIHND